MSEALELHIVRLDVFLHCLGGYGSVKPRVRRNKHELLTDDEIIEIRRLATSTYMPYGAVQATAERLAIPYRSFVVMLHHCRHGREPKALALRPDNLIRHLTQPSDGAILCGLCLRAI